MNRADRQRYGEASAPDRTFPGLVRRIMVQHFPQQFDPGRIFAKFRCRLPRDGAKVKGSRATIGKS
jgi:hypothetical protein